MLQIALYSFSISPSPTLVLGDSGHKIDGFLHDVDRIDVDTGRCVENDDDDDKSNVNSINEVFFSTTSSDLTSGNHLLYPIL